MPLSAAQLRDIKRQLATPGQAKGIRARALKLSKSPSPGRISGTRRHVYRTRCKPNKAGQKTRRHRNGKCMVYPWAKIPRKSTRKMMLKSDQTRIQKRATQLNSIGKSLPLYISLMIENCGAGKNGKGGITPGQKKKLDGYFKRLGTKRKKPLTYETGRKRHKNTGVLNSDGERVRRKSYNLRRPTRANRKGIRASNMAGCASYYVKPRACKNRAAYTRQAKYYLPASNANCSTAAAKKLKELQRLCKAFKDKNKRGRKSNPWKKTAGRGKQYKFGKPKVPKGGYTF